MGNTSMIKPYRLALVFALLVGVLAAGFLPGPGCERLDTYVTGVATRIGGAAGRGAQSAHPARRRRGAGAAGPGNGPFAARTQG